MTSTSLLINNRPKGKEKTNKQTWIQTQTNVCIDTHRQADRKADRHTDKYATKILYMYISNLWFSSVIKLYSALHTYPQTTMSTSLHHSGNLESSVRGERGKEGGERDVLYTVKLVYICIQGTVSRCPSYTDLRFRP